MLLEFLYGEKKIIRTPPSIRKVSTKRKYWFGYKEEYYIDFEYCSLGPMKLENVKEYLDMALRHTKYDI